MSQLRKLGWTLDDITDVNASIVLTLAMPNSFPSQITQNNNIRELMDLLSPLGFRLFTHFVTARAFYVLLTWKLRQREEPV